MSLLLPIKQRITWSLFENDTTWRFWKGNWILRVHMYLLSWRKTNFLCITSILSPKSMSKLINVNCLHFIGCQNYTNVLINRVSYQIQVTALLPFFLSILHLLLQLSKIMLWSTVKLLLAIVMSIIFGPLKNSSEVIEKLRLRNFQGSQVFSFDFSTLYTSLPHDLIKAKVLSLVNWCFNRESKSYLCTSLKAGFFSNKKYDSYRCWSCAELCEAFTFLMENIYVQFDGMVYQQIVGIPMGTNCAPLIADLFLYCYERDFMSDLQKSKRHDLIDMFNDTSRYLDDIFTIDNPEFEKYIPDIYPAELQLNKANTSDKETSFLDLNIKVILAVTFIPAFTTNAMTSDFLLLISHGWAVTFQDSHPTVFTFRSWLDLLDVVLAFWISILKISKLLQNCLHRVIDITSFEKHLESSLDRTPNFCLNLVIFRSKNMYLKESLTRSSTVI